VIPREPYACTETHVGDGATLTALALGGRTAVPPLLDVIVVLVGDRLPSFRLSGTVPSLHPPHPWATTVRSATEAAEIDGRQQAELVILPSVPHRSIALATRSSDRAPRPP
jgi:hypothetical protein